MLLFKYASAERIDILTNLEIRFTQIAELNDPFEMVPHVTAGKPPGHDEAPLSEFGSGMAELFGNALRSMLIRHQLTIDQFADRLTSEGFPVRPSDLLNPADTLKRMLNHVAPETLQSTAAADSFRSSLSRRFGVLSLSEVAASSLMWSHYGAQHRGLIIGFDSSHAFFRPKLELARLRKVTYSDERPRFALGALTTSDDEHTTQTVEALLFSKSVEWAYEREWRMIMPFDDAAQFPHRIVNERCHLFAMPPDAITCVVIGARADESLAAAVRGCTVEATT